MRRDFNAFVRACEKYGRHNLADVARDIESKTEEEVGASLRGLWCPERRACLLSCGRMWAAASCRLRACTGQRRAVPARRLTAPRPACRPGARQVRAYAKVFWERYTEINDHEKVGGGRPGLPCCPAAACGLPQLLGSPHVCLAPWLSLLALRQHSAPRTIPPTRAPPPAPPLRSTSRTLSAASSASSGSRTS